MIGKAKVIAVIPARGGSKGLPGKNIVDLCGRPVIVYTIEAALRSSYVDKVLVSTDDDRIAAIAKKYGAEVPFIRPKYLALDTAHTPPVIEHAVHFVERRGWKADYVVTLQPTSPLRTAHQIDEAITLLHRSHLDSVMSVKETGFPPFWTVCVTKGRAVPLVNNGVDYFRKERQQLPKTYQPNGALYVTKRSVLLKKKVVIARNCGVVIMDERTSMDIDVREDLEQIRSAIRTDAMTPGRMTPAGRR